MSDGIEQVNSSLSEESIRTKMLDAGEILFAEKGYAGTSVRDITSLAGCNVAAINYYFGGKMRLYEAVLDRYFDYMSQVRVGILESITRDEYTLEELIDGFGRVFAESLNGVAGKAGAIRLWMREMLDPQLDARAKAHKHVELVRGAFVKAVKKLFPEAEDDKISKCLMSLVGQIFHLSHMYMRTKQECEIPLVTSSYDEMVEHITLFTAAGFRAILGEGKEGGNAK